MQAGTVQPAYAVSAAVVQAGTVQPAYGVSAAVHSSSQPAYAVSAAVQAATVQPVYGVSTSPTHSGTVQPAYGVSELLVVGCFERTQPRTIDDHAEEAAHSSRLTAMGLNGPHTSGAARASWP